MIKEVERVIEDGKEIIKNFEEASAKLENYAEKLYSEIKGALIEKYSKYDGSEDVNKVVNELTEDIYDILGKLGNDDLVMKMVGIGLKELHKELLYYNIYDLSQSYKCFGSISLDDIEHGFLSHGPYYAYTYSKSLFARLLRCEIINSTDLVWDYP